MLTSTLLKFSLDQQDNDKTRWRESLSPCCYCYLWRLPATPFCCLFVSPCECALTIVYTEVTGHGDTGHGGNGGLEQIIMKFPLPLKPSKRVLAPPMLFTSAAWKTTRHKSQPFSATDSIINPKQMDGITWAFW